MQDGYLSIRLEKLERQTRFWQLFGVLAGIICAISLVIRLNAAPVRVDATAVVAHEFDLVNTSGRITARLASDPDNKDSPNLVLKYADDKPAILLGIDSKAGSSISLLDSRGQARAIISEQENGPLFSLFDEHDRLRIIITTAAGTPQVVIYDANTKKIWSAPSVQQH